DYIGYTRDELLKMSFSDITHPDDLDISLSLLTRCLNGEIPEYTLEKRYIRKDGNVVWGELTSSIMFDSTGEPLYRFAVIQDITARKASEQVLEARVNERTKELHLLIEEMQKEIRERITAEKNLSVIFNKFGETKKEIFISKHRS